MESIHAVFQANILSLYPGKAEQFLEAVLSIPEKLSGLARKSKAVGDLNARYHALQSISRRDRGRARSRR
jgi:hypothetical protein